MKLLKREFLLLHPAKKLAHLPARMYAKCWMYANHNDARSTHCRGVAISYPILDELNPHTQDTTMSFLAEPEGNIMSKKHEITPFNFEGHNVRIVLDEQGEPLFVGKDVCKVPGYANHNEAISTHCRGVAISYQILDELNRMRDTRVLSEPDMMRLVANCTLPAGIAFEKRVFEEILPTLRKSGSYTSNKQNSVSPISVTQMSRDFRALFGIAKLISCDKNAAAISAKPCER